MKLLGILYMCFALVTESYSFQKVDSLTQQLEVTEDTSRVKVLVMLARELMFSDPPLSLKYTEEAISESERLQFVWGKANGNNMLAILNAEKGNYEQAVQYALESLQMFQELGDRKAQRNQLNVLGIINRYLKDYEQSLQYYHQALAITEELHDRQTLPAILGNMGNAYLDLGDYDKALEYQLRSLEVDQEFGNQAGISKTTHNIGEIYEEKGDYDNALEYMKRSLKMDQEANNKRGLVISYTQIASIYIKKQDFEQAFAHAQRALEIAEEINSRNKVNVLYQLSEASSGLGKHQQALEYYRRHKQVYDSLFNEEKSQQIAELQTQYQTDQKEQQIASQEQEIALLEQKEAADRNLRLTLIAAAILLLLVLIFIYGRYRMKQRSEQALQEKNQEIAGKNQEIKEMNKELEKRLLRAQMDPHFIFNSLNSIQHFITVNDKDSALRYLSKFAKLIRQVLENSATQMVPIADEIKLLEYYIQLEALRFDSRFQHSIEVDESLDIHNTDIPFLILQPYVENSIVHGLKHRENGGKLHIILKHEKEHILCTIEDNGIGREAAQQKNLLLQKDHKSRGLSVTQQRLQVLNRQQVKQTSVTVTDLHDHSQQPSGTKVEILIPFDLN